jgi:hypothetical protein
MAHRCTRHNEFNIVEFAMHHAVAGWHKTIPRSSVTSERKGEFAFAAGEFAFPQNWRLPNCDAVDRGQRARRRRAQQNL